VRVAKTLLVALVAVLLFAAPAFAQADPYPGNSGPKDPQPTHETNSQGPYGPRSSLFVESCGFKPGTSLTKSWNDEAAGSGAADPNGCIEVRVQFVEPAAGGQAFGSGMVAAASPGRALAAAAMQLAASCRADALVDGQRHAAKQGRNTLSVLGTGSNEAPREVTTNVTMQCSGDSTATASGTEQGRSLARVDDGGLLGPAFARTGGMIARWTAVGMLLIALGFGLVVFERRRLARRIAD
jgi:hypothetical protein